jgi:NAD(P)-dependent dehydrogenase (short-subunit alcohol dehydrogenase family)
VRTPHGAANPADARASFSRLRVAVTGGTSGLGLALVRELARQGADVALVARHPEGIATVIRQVAGAHGITGDVASKDDIYPIAMQILGSLGGLDVLINNASDLGPVPLALLGDTACEDLEKALATNLLGPFRLTKALLGALTAAARERGGAVVVNIASDAAVNPYPRWGAYGASKAALHHLSRIWDEELAAEGVRFLSLDPGDMDTPLHALAVPDADPATLRRPEAAALEILAAISAIPAIGAIGATVAAPPRPVESASASRQGDEGPNAPPAAPDLGLNAALAGGEPIAVSPTGRSERMGAPPPVPEASAAMPVSVWRVS